jgi:hypothetical protein
MPACVHVHSRCPSRRNITEEAAGNRRFHVRSAPHITSN